MMGFAIAALIVAVLGSLIWLGVKAMDGSVWAGAVLAGIITVVLGVVINTSTKESEKGPCHQYETRPMYNSEKLN